jgi:hypothetical protein
MSSLKAVKFIDYNANYAYSPPERDAVINTHEIITVVPIERGSTRRPFDDLVRIRFHDGSWMDVIGKPGDFVGQQERQS